MKELRALLDKHKAAINADFENGNEEATLVIRAYHLWHASESIESAKILIMAIRAWRDKK